MKSHLLQVTNVGQTVLSSTLQGFPTEEHPSVDASQPSLVVQPNFELLFLAPDHLRAIYQILPFVEIQQIDRVSRARLTRAALHDGMGFGRSIEQVIAILSELNQKNELPQNVIYELNDWARKHQAAQLSQVVLIELSSESVTEAVYRLESVRELGVRRVGVNPDFAPEQCGLCKRAE
jgi:hypothetical protein